MPQLSPIQEFPILVIAIAIVVGMSWPGMPAIAVGFPVAMILLWLQPVAFFVIDSWFDEGEE